MSISSAEVAADFKDALQDLKVNSRPEISNLTIIAKENTEHAQAISRELENHIRTTRPEWKLPALYVLDSIVKNVGTPYTVYLGRNLYRTFMDAYLVMDPGHRRAMEGLLKTWKQPVPESMDPRPVFGSDTTRDIETALIKIKTVQEQARPVHGLPPRPAANPGATQWRNTPTPPQNLPRYAAPNDPRVRQPYPPASQYGQFPPTGTPPQQFPPAQQYQQPFPQQQLPVSSNDLENLKGDLAKLITTTKTAWALNSNDPQIPQKLKALEDLQTILNTQTIPPQQLQAVRAQIQALSPTPPSMPMFAPPLSVPPPAIQSPQQNTPPTFPPANPPVNIAQLLAGVRPASSQTPTPANPTPNLADILRRVSSPTQTSPPTAAPPLFPPAFPIPPQSATPSAPTLAEILANINKQGTPIQASAQPPPLPPLPIQQLGVASATGGQDWLSNIVKSLGNVPTNGTPGQSTPLGSAPMTRQVSATASTQTEVELTTASIKKPRLNLIQRLYEAYPNICATCGRRFEATPQGKEKKARHMDWHFKVRDPDASKRGIHRSWYISEKEWIDYREVDEASPEQATNGPKATIAPKKEPKDKYVRVPTDDGLRHAPCPICQETFDTNMKWHNDANDFVWMDAINVNGKIYHATCWDEYSKGAGIATPGTPDSVLGKRKAEVGSPASGKKIRAY